MREISLVCFRDSSTQWECLTWPFPLWIPEEKNNALLFDYNHSFDLWINSLVSHGSNYFFFFFLSLTHSPTFITLPHSLLPPAKCICFSWCLRDGATVGFFLVFLSLSDWWNMKFFGGKRKESQAKRVEKEERDREWKRKQARIRGKKKKHMKHQKRLEWKKKE